MTKEQSVEVARLQGVHKNYGAVRALFDMDFAVRQGEIVALLGPNGAGKTSVIKLLLGLARATSGRVSVFGADPWSPASRARIGVMLQTAAVPETLRVREHIDLFSAYYPRPLPVAQTVRIAGLEGLEERPFGELSGGQKQRVLFAIALCGDPDLLLLDEPTVGLDVELRHVVWEAIRRAVSNGKSVLLTTHYMQEADELASRVVIIDKGTVVAEGTPAEIKARTGTQRIRCATRLSVAEVQGFPGVVTVRQDRGVLEILVKRAEPVLRQLLSRDADLSGTEVTGSALEEAFLALTQNDRMERAG